MRKLTFLCFLFPLLLLQAACDKAPEVASFHGMTMGTTYSVKIVTDGSIDIPALQKRVDDELKQLNQTFSTYIPDSELMQLNSAPIQTPQQISSALHDVLDLNLELQQLSDGHFSMAIGPLINLWGFGEAETSANVSSDAVAQMLNAIDTTEALELTPTQLTKRKPLHLNLSATAKGYGVDRIAELIQGMGYDNFLVEIGGELRGQGAKPNNEPWIIAIEKPIANERAFQQLLGVNNISVATSGDYRNFVEKDGQRLSHIIDPKTGYPIRHSLASVTVLHQDCAMADGLATAMLVMGEESARELAKSLDVAVYLISKSEDGFTTWHNDAMQSYFLN